MLDISLKSMTYPNGYTALKGIELQFPSVGMFMIVGESGCGKSSLLKCLSGRLDFSGSLKYGEEVLKGQALVEFSHNEVAYIFQDYKLFENLSAIDNVILGGQITGQKVDKDSALNNLKEVGIDNLSNKKVKLLSGGEKQRVAIARALVKDAKIMIADEPTGNLDSKNSEVVMSLLKEISKSKLVVVVTHDTGLAQKFGDKIIKMSDGIVSDIVDNRHTNDDPIAHNETSAHDINSGNAVNKKIGIKSFFQLVFLRSYGSKLIATSALTLIVCVIAIFSTMIAAQNKTILTSRYLAGQKSSLAKTTFINDNGQQVFLEEQDCGEFDCYVECDGWSIDLSIDDGENDRWQSDSDIGRIDFCVQQSEKEVVVNYLYGSSPHNIHEIAIPKSIAQTLDKDIESVLGRQIKVNTGTLKRDFIVKGIFDNCFPDILQKYIDTAYDEFINKDEKERDSIRDILDDCYDCFLNRCVVVNSIRDLLNTSTAEKIVGNSFKCKKGGMDIVLYNGSYLSKDVAEGEAVLSSSLYALSSMISMNELSKGLFSFSFFNENIEKSFAGVESSLDGYSIVLNEEDYFDLIDLIDIRYSGIVFDSSRESIGKVYKSFKLSQDQMICYISGNYMGQDFLDAIKTIEAINLKIMLPIAIIFWALSTLCMYIMLKNLVMANKKNLDIMQALGIKRSRFIIVNCVSYITYLLAVAILSVFIAACLNAILSSSNLFMPLKISFIGWEFLSLILSIIIALICALLYLRKTEK